MIFVQLGRVGFLPFRERVARTIIARKLSAVKQQELVHFRTIQREIRPCGPCALLTSFFTDTSTCETMGNKRLGSLHASVQLGECFQLWCCTFRSFQKFRECRRVEKSSATFATCDQHGSNDFHLYSLIRQEPPAMMMGSLQL